MHFAKSKLQVSEEMVQCSAGSARLLQNNHRNACASEQTFFFVVKYVIHAIYIANLKVCWKLTHYKWFTQDSALMYVDK